MAELTNEQKTFFSAMESTFATAGWQHFMLPRWQEEQKMLQESTFFNAENEIDLVKARERFDLLEELITLPEKIQAQREAAETGEGEHEQIHVL